MAWEFEHGGEFNDEMLGRYGMYFTLLAARITCQPLRINSEPTGTLISDWKNQHTCRKTKGVNVKNWFKLTLGNGSLGTGATTYRVFYFDQAEFEFTTIIAGAINCHRLH